MHTAIGSLCFILLLSTVDMLNIFGKDSNNFGPYDLSWTRYEVCKGPKPKTLTVFSSNITTEGDRNFGAYNVTFPIKTTLDEIKIMVYSINNNIKNLLWTYKVTDPCNHFALGVFIITFFKAQNCAIEKGSYYAYLNINEVTESFLGSSFFYGDFLLKAVVTSKQGNIMCLNMVHRFKKKAEAKI